MKKRMLMIMMIAAIGVSGFSVSMISAKTVTNIPQQYEDDDTYDEDEYDDEGEYDDEYDDEGEYDDEYDDEDEYDGEYDDAYEFTKDDFIVRPAKKTIKVKKSFTIDIYPSDDIADEYADLPEEEWQELLDENIDSITYRSTKSSIASVSRTGKVKGKKKGSTIIKTTITFRDGSEGSYKTKVYVTR